MFLFFPQKSISKISVILSAIHSPEFFPPWVYSLFTAGLSLATFFHYSGRVIILVPLFSY